MNANEKWGNYGRMAKTRNEGTTLLDENLTYFISKKGRKEKKAMKMKALPYKDITYLLSKKKGGDEKEGNDNCEIAAQTRKARDLYTSHDPLEWPTHHKTLMHAEMVPCRTSTTGMSTPHLLMRQPWQLLPPMAASVCLLQGRVPLLLLGCPPHCIPVPTCSLA